MHNTDTPQTLFNIKQAAFILRVHPLTLRRYINEGKLKAVKAGGNIRIKEEDLQEFQKDISPGKREAASPFTKQKIKPSKTFTEDDHFLKLDGRAASLTFTS